MFFLLISKKFLVKELKIFKNNEKIGDFCKIF